MSDSPDPPSLLLAEVGIISGQKQTLESILPKVSRTEFDRNSRGCGSSLKLTRTYANKCCGAMAGAVNSVLRCAIWKFTIRHSAVTQAKIPN